MFQEIHLHLAGRFEEDISSGFISKKGLVVAVSKSKRIIIFHQSSPHGAAHLDKELRENFEFKFAKCKEIYEVPNNQEEDSFTTLLLLLDETLCIISLKLAHEDHENKIVTEIKRIKLVKLIEEDDQIANRKFELKLIGMRSNTVMFYLHFQRAYLKLIAYHIQITQYTINLSKTISKTLMQVENNGNPTNDLLLGLGNFKIRWFGHHLILFDQYAFEGQANLLISIDLNLLDGQSKTLYELPVNHSSKILQEVYLIPSNKELTESPLLLFYQQSGFLEVIEVTLSNSSVALKQIKYSSTVLYNILHCSMTPELLDLKGEEYCIQTLNFLIHGKTALHLEDSLMIIAAPFAIGSKEIINSIALPPNVKHLTANYVVCAKQIHHISLRSKQSIYRQLLKQLSDSQPLARAIQQILD